jgi:hypothetical protein
VSLLLFLVIRVVFILSLASSQPNQGPGELVALREKNLVLVEEYGCFVIRSGSSESVSGLLGTDPSNTGISFTGDTQLSVAVNPTLTYLQVRKFLYLIGTRKTKQSPLGVLSEVIQKRRTSQSWVPDI